MIIKQRDSNGIASFLMSGGNKTAPSAADDAASVQRSATVELMEKLANCENEIAGHEAALAKAYDDGVKAGRLAAEDSFEDDRAEALATLASALTDAKQQLSDALQGFETLALASALEALKVLIGDPESYRAILTAAIQRQLQRLDGASVISVTLSRSDFPDSNEVAAIEQEAGLPPKTVIVDTMLHAGKCDIKLSIGTVEFDLQRNWDQIAAILSPVPVEDNVP